jgi:hypothetical protein
VHVNVSEHRDAAARAAYRLRTPLVCHSERNEESLHFFALIELSNAGILLPEGGIRMTGGGLFFYE